MDKTHLVAVDAHSGKLCWEYAIPVNDASQETDNQPYANWPIPKIKNGYVYLKTDNGILTALEIQMGKVSWQFETGVSGFIPPLVMEDRAYIQNKNGLVALNAHTGNLLWEAQLGISSAFFTETSIIITEQGDMLYAGNACDGALYALKAETGEILWEFNDPVIANLNTIKMDTRSICVFLGDEKSDIGYDRVKFRKKPGLRHIFVFSDTGNLLWKITDCWCNPYSLVDGILYMAFAQGKTAINNRVVSESQSGIAAFSVATGKVLWQLSNPLSIVPVYASGTTVYYALPCSKLYGFDTKTGEELWQLPIEVDGFIGEKDTLIFTAGSKLVALSPKPKGLLPEQEAYISLLGIGTAQVALKYYESAIPPLKEALELRSDLAEAYWQLCLAYEGLGLREQFQKSCDQYIRLVPCR